MPIRFQSVFPRLQVQDVAATAAWYREVLGCRIALEAAATEGVFAIVDFEEGQGFHFGKARGEVARSDQTRATIRIDDADAWHARIAQRGAKILAPPAERPGKTRDFEVADLNGCVLRFSADLTGVWPRGKVVVSPELAIADLARTAAFFRDALAFQRIVLFGQPPAGGIAVRDGALVHLAPVPDAGAVHPNRETGGAWDAFFEVTGIEEFAAELRARNVPIARGIVLTEYRMRELDVVDADGHILCFGEPECGW